MLKKKILVVDDDEDIREIMMIVLESAGYEVLGLDCGRVVIDTVKESRPDVLLLDVQLGDRDGRDICRELKENPSTQNIPIIIVSASHGWPTLHEKQCSADDFIAKPFDINDLVKQVRQFAA